jgi:hypothetical protein
MANNVSISFAPSPRGEAIYAPAIKPRSEYNIAVGYLRAVVTVMVLAHHAVLAYHPYMPDPPTSMLAQPRLWQAFPVMDSHRSGVFAWFVGYNDIFFMSLMFLLSGLFVWPSLQRKGSGKFLRDRFLRLGIPFVVAAAVIAPLAYYPAYLQISASGTAPGFWHEWLALGNWPAGPVWFVWVLLAFDCVAAGLLALSSKWGERLGCALAAPSKRPWIFFLVLSGISAGVYLPLVIKFGPMYWSAFGPFFFQTSRILHYLVYFLIGAGLGAYGLHRGLLAPDGKLARRWYLWLTISAITFTLAVGVLIASLASPASARLWNFVGGIAFVLACASACLAFLAFFTRFAKREGAIMNSLRDNAYGMYVIHYAFVSWLQYALLKSQMSGLTKGVLVTAGTVALSWIAMAMLRRIPVVARII